MRTEFEHSEAALRAYCSGMRRLHELHTALRLLTWTLLIAAMLVSPPLLIEPTSLAMPFLLLAAGLSALALIGVLLTGVTIRRRCEETPTLAVIEGWEAA